MGIADGLAPIWFQAINNHMQMTQSGQFLPGVT